MFGVRGPGEEHGDILSQLRCIVWSAIFEVNHFVVQGTRHADCAAGEVRVVVETLSYRDASRRVGVSQEEGEDIVLLSVSGTNDARQIWRIGAGICLASGFFVGIGTWHGVCKLTRPHEVLSVIIRPVSVLILGCHVLGFLLGMSHTNQIAPMDVVHRMTSSTDLSIDLVATSQPKQYIQSLVVLLLNKTYAEWS